MGSWIIKLDGKEIGRMTDDQADDEMDAVVNWADECLTAEHSND